MKPPIRSIALDKEQAAVLLAVLVYARGKAGHDLLTTEGMGKLDQLVALAKEVTDLLIEDARNA